MQMKFSTTLVAASIAVFAGHASASTNLITNGSFETGNFGSAWTVTDAGTTPYAAVVPYGPNFYGENVPSNPAGSASPDASGNYGVYFVSDFASPESLSQIVTPLTSGLYTLGFSAYVPLNGYDNVGKADFTGSIGGVNLVSTEVHSLTPQTWYNFYGSANLTAGVPVTAQFTFNTNFNPSADIVIDQVYLVAGGVPEPATWAMMLVGFGFAGSALRRRRSLAA
jgi:hypothetical protein